MFHFIVVFFGVTAAWNREWTMDEVETMDHQLMFQKWASAIGRNYSSAVEERSKFQIWMNNLHVIARTNSRNLSYKLALNQFSDMTPKEFRSHLGIWNEATVNTEHRSNIIEPYMISGHTLSDDSIPSFIDWTTYGVVPPIPNAFSNSFCASCWAFAATAAIECKIAIQQMRIGILGPIVPLSVQNLLDCTPNSALGADGKPDGCQGNNAGNAMIYAERNGGLCASDDYPDPNLHQFGVTQSCQDQLCSAKYYSPSKVLGQMDITANELKGALTNQCVVVEVDATGDEFMQYSSGVYTEECGTNGGHQMLAVGYGEENGEKYWKLWNMLGTWWYVSNVTPIVFQ